MPTYYRGAAPGTYWHRQDAKVIGFHAHQLGMVANQDRLVEHIARGTTISPFVSLTKSFGIARNYATPGASATKPGFVYQIEIPQDRWTAGLTLIDPIKEVAAQLDSFGFPGYQHDGDQDFLIGVLAPQRFLKYTRRRAAQRPGDFGTPRAALLSPQLETLVRALRDAEILALGVIPPSCVVGKFPIS